MRVALAALFALGPGCGETTATQLVVVVATDLDEGEIDGYRIEVQGPNGAVVDDRSFAVAEDPLPASFGVAPRDDDASRRVTVEATALLGGEELFSTRAVTRYVPERRSLLYLFLAERCRAETCRPEETCGRAGCVSPEIDPEDLPEWTGIPDAAVPDASVALPDGGSVTPPFSPLWLARGVDAWATAIVASGDSLFLVGGCLAPCSVVDAAPIGQVGEALAWVVELEDGAVAWSTVLPSQATTVSVTDASLDPDGETLWLVGTMSVGALCDGAVVARDDVSSFAVAVDRDGGTCERGLIIGPGVISASVLATDDGPLLGGQATMSFTVGGATIEVDVGVSLDPFLVGPDTGPSPAAPWKVYDWRATESGLFLDAARDGPTFFVTGTMSAGTLTLEDVSYDQPIEAFVWSGSVVPGDDAPTAVATMTSDQVLQQPRIAVRPDGSVAWLVGNTQGDVVLDGGPVGPWLGASDFVVAIVGRPAAASRLAVHGSAENEVPADVCALGDRVVAIGSVVGATEIERFAVGTDGVPEVLVLLLDDQLALLDAHSFGGPASTFASVAHCDAERGHVWIAGTTAGDVLAGANELLLGDFDQGAFLVREDAP